METAEIPPERVENKFQEWEQRYAVTSLEEMTLNDLQSEFAVFENEVARFKKEYHPGRLVTPELAVVMGKEPLTQGQFQEVRRLIDDEATKIRLHFKRAIGRTEDRYQDRRHDLIAEVAGRISSALTDVNISITLPKLR